MGTTDREFTGNWDNQPQMPPLMLTVEHLVDSGCEPNPDRAGWVEAVGLNTGADSPWQKFAFTGKVTMVGRAEGNAQLWRSAPGPDDEPFITIPVTLTRRSNTIEMELNYEFEGLQIQEFYFLTKR